MSKMLVVAVLAAIILDLLVAGYGAVAARQDGYATCSQDHGAVQHSECMRDGRDLFHVPL